MADEVFPTASPNPTAALGYDGTDFRTLGVDTDGNVQTDIVTVAPGSGLATETTLASILTELGQKLETADLSLEDVTKYLNTVVKVCALPTGAATAAKQDEQTTLLESINLLTHALGMSGSDFLLVKPGFVGIENKYLTVDADGHTQVDVLTSALPTGAATSAKQDTEITALQLIDDLRNALASVATDQLKVKGQDQLISYKSQVLYKYEFTATTAVMFVTSGAVPAGEIWHITAVALRNVNRAAPAITIGIKEDGDTYYWISSGSTAVMSAYYTSTAHMYLDAGNRVAGHISGCTVDDKIQMTICGFRMTKEA